MKHSHHHCLIMDKHNNDEKLYSVCIISRELNVVIVMLPPFVIAETPNTELKLAVTLTV